MAESEKAQSLTDDEATLKKIAEMINNLPKEQRTREILHLLGWVTREYRKGKVSYID